MRLQIYAFVAALTFAASFSMMAFADNQAVQHAYSHLPLGFEANKGQTSSQVKFLSRGSGYSLFLMQQEAVLVLGNPDSGLTALSLSLPGSNPKSSISASDRLPGNVNYFLGNSPAKWHSNVPSFARVRYENVYPGVDLVYYGNQQQLEYDFVVSPDGNPSAIQLLFKGATRVSVDSAGNLILRTGKGNVVQQAPRIYQMLDGEPRTVSGGYVKLAANKVGFRTGSYLKSEPLVIDPTLVYSSFLGGNHYDKGNGIAVDADGFAYVTGQTCSPDFPTTPGAFQTVYGGPANGWDAFVSKISPDGRTLVYSTFLGGTGKDYGNGIAVATEADGTHAFVVGNTDSTDFPTTPGVIQQLPQGMSDGFVTKLTVAGDGLVYSTYLGGTENDYGNGIAVYTDASQNHFAVVTGRTYSSGFPHTPGAFQGSLHGTNDAFVTELNPDATGLVFSTFLGGDNDDRGNAIAVDSDGFPYVTGTTNSGTFPTTPGVVQPNPGGGDDAFVTKLQADGSGLVYSTYLGGSSTENGRGIAVSAAGEAHVTGVTFSSNFRTTPNAYQPSPSGGSVFMSKLNSSATALLYSTYFGAEGQEVGDGDQGNAIAVDSSGLIYVTGESENVFGCDFPITPDAYQTVCGGLDDVFFSKFDPSLSGTASLVYSTYLGGFGDDWGAGVAVYTDDMGLTHAYLTGATASAGFPILPPDVFQPTFGGGPFDAFVAHFRFPN